MNCRSRYSFVMKTSTEFFFCALLFWACNCYEVIADAESENCCCEEKKTANVFSVPSERIDNKQIFNYTDNVEDIFRKIGNDSDIIRTAETLDKGYYTALCWSEIITLTERRNGTNTVSKEYAITFETKSDIPDKYLKLDNNTKFGREYKQYHIYDQATRKSEIVNFTTISKSNEAIVRQSRKMFCGSGPVYTKEFMQWSQSGRKRVEIKVSPKMQNLIASNLSPNISSYKTNTTRSYTIPTEIIERTRYPQENSKKTTISPDYFYNNNMHATHKIIPPHSFRNSTTYHFYTNGDIVPTEHSNSALPDERVSVSIPQIINSINPVKQHFTTDYNSSPKYIKGKVEKVTSNPILADDQHKIQNDKPTTRLKNQFRDQPFRSATPQFNIFTSSYASPETTSTSNNNSDTTVNTNPEVSRTTVLSTSQNPNVSQRPLSTLQHSITTIATTPDFDYDDDFSDELGDIRKDVTKSTDCTDVTDKLTTLRKNVFTTIDPNLNSQNLQGTTKSPIDIGDSANRIAIGDYQNPNNEHVRKGTETAVPVNDLSTLNVPTARTPEIKHCILPPQKIKVKVKISIDLNMKPIELSEHHLHSVPIMGIEKIAEIPINSIKEIPTVPDELINAEWNTFMKDLGNQFFTINKEQILNYTQLVSNNLNLTAPESELDYQILPEETVKRLQGIKDYLRFCQTFTQKKVNELGVIPEFRFSGELGQQGPMISLKPPSFGFYNYMLPPQYSAGNSFPIQQKGNYGSLGNDYSTYNLKQPRMNYLSDLKNKMQYYDYLPTQYNNPSKLGNNSPLTIASLPNDAYRVLRNGQPYSQEETSASCPGCTAVNEFTNSLNRALSHLQTLLQAKNER